LSGAKSGIASDPHRSFDLGNHNANPDFAPLNPGYDG
jgi:hypothetical protein